MIVVGLNQCWDIQTTPMVVAMSKRSRVYDEPVGVAIVNAIGKIRQFVAPGTSDPADKRRYLVIAPQVSGKPGARVQVQAL